MKYSIRRKKGFTLVEIMIVVVIIGLLAVMAIPAFQKVRAAAQTNAVKNNLRQISNGADQYFLQNGVTTVAYADLVGPDKTIKSLTSVAGENYIALFPITPAKTSAEISITVPGLDNAAVTYGTSPAAAAAE